MASKTDLQITIIGAGRNQFGLRLLGIVARLFGIRLEVVRPTKRALDAANVCRVINHFYVDGVCSQCGSIEPPRQ